LRDDNGKYNQKLEFAKMRRIRSWSFLIRTLFSGEKWNVIENHVVA
jgi:hypothetical protein